MMSGGMQPLLPCGNGGFGQDDEVTTPTTEFPQSFKTPSQPRESLLYPDYLMNALACAKQLKQPDTEYYEDKFEPVSVKKEPKNWVRFNNNPGAVYTNEVNDKNLAMGGHNNLFVGNLPLECTEAKLYDLFSTYGNVIDVRIEKKYDLDRQVLYVLCLFLAAKAQLNTCTCPSVCLSVRLKTEFLPVYTSF